MALKGGLTAAAFLAGESLAFLLVLLAVVRPLGDALPWWPVVGIAGLAFALLGAVPVPRGRRPFIVALSAFLAPLVVLGWIGWRVELSHVFERLRDWESLPSVIAAPANLVTALFLSSCAVSGFWLARRIHKHSR